jgi:hypothetical protein
MNMELSLLLLGFATVLAPIARGQSTPPQPKITGVLVILSPKPGVTVEQVMKIMPAEISRHQATLAARDPIER